MFDGRLWEAAITFISKIWFQSGSNNSCPYHIPCDYGRCLWFCRAENVDSSNRFFPTKDSLKGWFTMVYLRALEGRCTHGWVHRQSLICPAPPMKSQFFWYVNGPDMSRHAMSTQASQARQVVSSCLPERCTVKPKLAASSQKPNTILNPGTS